MISSGTLIYILDNTGIRRLNTIKVIGPRADKRGGAKIGDTIIGSIRRLKPLKKIKKGDLCKIILVQTRNITSRNTGQYLKGFINGGVVLKKSEKYIPMGSRLLSFGQLELRRARYLRIASLMPDIL